MSWRFDAWRRKPEDSSLAKRQSVGVPLPAFCGPGVRTSSRRAVRRRRPPSQKSSFHALSAPWADVQASRELRPDGGQTGHLQVPGSSPDPSECHSIEHSVEVLELNGDYDDKQENEDKQDKRVYWAPGSREPGAPSRQEEAMKQAEEQAAGRAFRRRCVLKKERSNSCFWARSRVRNARKRGRRPKMLARSRRSSPL